jgi:antitoxin component of MazEF toxin-antitoxin module
MEMPVKFTIKVGTVGHSLKATIPMELAECLDLHKGDKVSMWEESGHIILEKKK